MRHIERIGRSDRVERRRVVVRLYGRRIGDRAGRAIRDIRPGRGPDVVHEGFGIARPGGACHRRHDRRGDRHGRDCELCAARIERETVGEHVLDRERTGAFACRNNTVGRKRCHREAGRERHGSARVHRSRRRTHAGRGVVDIERIVAVDRRGPRARNVVVLGLPVIGRHMGVADRLAQDVRRIDVVRHVHLGLVIHLSVHGSAGHLDRAAGGADERLLGDRTDARARIADGETAVIGQDIAGGQRILDNHVVDRDTRGDIRGERIGQRRRQVAGDVLVFRRTDLGAELDETRRRILRRRRADDRPVGAGRRIAIFVDRNHFDRKRDVRRRQRIDGRADVGNDRRRAGHDAAQRELDQGERPAHRSGDVLARDRIDKDSRQGEGADGRRGQRRGQEIGGDEVDFQGERQLKVGTEPRRTGIGHSRREADLLAYKGGARNTETQVGDRRSRP